ncbi:hypothetical protein FXF51_35165 [Nonomuraea sp. PA05]|uniref:hypothetical protein n=1 Tax=Nonomuraea sp. PA05 TaxID=2604466 RepID=UPI0011D95302|nr:hypothetical protein [Nonomuraea sp. PA05]TYB59213.1 hypothetical protein FXF51_35165 [Nonomuraea sp. PA05]
MSVEMPGWAATLLEGLGYWWTQADEDLLAQAGVLVAAAEPLLDAVRDLAGASSAQVWTDNVGQEFDTFRTAWAHEDGPQAVLSDATSGMLAVGGGLYVSAALVLFLKTTVLVQLSALATAILQATALAGATMGTSLLQIPVLKEITGRLIGLLINLAVGILL